MNSDAVSKEAQNICVHHEWGVLKEVVVGIPFFQIAREVPEHLKEFSATKGLAFIVKHRGKTVEEADPQLHARMTRQMNDVIEVLTDRGVIVHRPEPLNEFELQYLDGIEPKGGMQIFPRDPILVIGDNVIELEPFSPLRRRERFGLRRALSERLANSNARFISMPPALPLDQQRGNSPASPLLEGGDVFVLGRDIYVGVSGNASNSEGVAWLQQYLGSDYAVHEVRLTKKFLHLDCCLSTPREGLGIICREAFVDGLPAFLKEWDLIELPFEEAKEKLGCNGLILDEKTIIIHEKLPGLAKKLRNAGQEVIEKPFDAIYFFSGAFRCWHHPLVRESSL